MESIWVKPESSRLTVPDTAEASFNYDFQYIIQLEDDPIVYNACMNLINKHLEKSTWVQLAKNKQFIGYQYDQTTSSMVKVPEITFNEMINVRVSLVGHGNAYDNEFGSLDITKLKNIMNLFFDLDVRKSMRRCAIEC